MSEEQLAIGDDAIHGVSSPLLTLGRFSLTNISDLDRKSHTPSIMT